MNELTTEKTMTIQEVADALSVSRSLIEKTTRELFPELMRNGKTTHLNEKQVTAIKLKVTENPHLVRSSEVTTDLEMEILSRKVDLWKDEKIKRLTEQNAIMTPKAEAWDQFMDGTNAQKIGSIAKMFGIGPNIFHRMLREEKIIQSNHTPYQEYAHHFTVKEVPTPVGNKLTTYVLPSGVEYLARRFRILNHTVELKVVGQG